MEVSLFKTLWGHDGPSSEAGRLVSEAGFDGIEGPYPEEAKEREVFDEVISSGDLLFIAEVSTCTPFGFYVPSPGKSPKDHLDSLRSGIEGSLEGKPLFINTMAGSDAWSFSEAVEFYAKVPDLESEYRISVSLETHRGRYLNSPWSTHRILEEIPDLKLTCDFSHFCVVAERLVLEEEADVLKACADHAFHLQTRVGYSQGPQVPDPRAPEHENDLTTHERWWDEVWKSQLSRGFEHFTITPEFGPDGYLHCAPFSGEPVADLWEINQWIGLREKKRLLSQLDPISLT
ncbi:MAG: TIM barrel protein [Verrucomicrobiota bacterium]